MLRIVNKLPEIWFKDEGGKEKGLEVMVQLVNSSGHLVTDRKVPVKLVLKYENNHEVRHQELLKLSADSRRIIDESGTATIRFRIEDVSKNHQRQSFGIMVAPDVVCAPQSADIGSVTSNFVDIKSKVNKKKRRNRRDKEDDDSIVSKHIRLLDGQMVSGAVGIASLMDVGGLGLGMSTMPPGSLSIAGAGTGAAAAPSAPVGVSRLGSGGNPVQTVYTWVNQVLQSMDTMTWRLVGYERLLNGIGEDRSKPMYAMNNPNTVR